MYIFIKYLVIHKSVRFLSHLNISKNSSSKYDGRYTCRTYQIFTDRHKYERNNHIKFHEIFIIFTNMFFVTQICKINKF